MIDIFANESMREDHLEEESSSFLHFSFDCGARSIPLDEIPSHKIPFPKIFFNISILKK